MNIFNMCTRYTICLMICIGGSPSQMFCNSGDCGPELLKGIVTPSRQTQDECGAVCCTLIVGCLALGAGAGIYNDFVIKPNQAATCNGYVNQVHQWQPGLTLLQQYDYGEMFVQHPAQTTRRIELQCSASLAKILNKEKLSNILGLAAGPQDQSMDEDKQAKGCSLLDQLEKQNKYSQQYALNTFKKMFSGTSASWPLNSFNNNVRDIGEFRAKLRCPNMAEEDVKRLASAQACLTLRSSKDQAQKEYDTSTQVIKPTQEDFLRKRVSQARLKQIEEDMKKEKCD